MPRIHYETAGGDVQMIKRDEHHTDQDPLLTAYNYNDDGAVVSKVQIPLQRVVRIHS